MCNKDMIESYKSVLGVLKRRHPQYCPKGEDKDLHSAELDTIVSNERRLFYGILTIGKDTTAEIELPDGSLFELASNTQDIEVFRDITFTSVEKNAYFRGWEITMS